MAKSPTPRAEFSLPKPEVSERLSWPQGPKDLCPRPRVFRIQRLDAYAWQAFVIEGSKEHPIGKPDVFDIVSRKVAGVMRAEGQVEFLTKKTESALETKKDA